MASELEPQMKEIMQSFLNGIQLQEQYVLESQKQLNSILDRCLSKT